MSEPQTVRISKVNVCSRSWAIWLLCFAGLWGIALWIMGARDPLGVFYLGAILINVLALVLYLGLIPVLVDRRENENFRLEDDILRWSGGKIPLNEIHGIVLFVKPDGDVRRMRISSRRLYLDLRDSMEEYKPLADRLRERLPENKIHIQEI